MPMRSVVRFSDGDISDRRGGEKPRDRPISLLRPALTGLAASCAIVLGAILGGSRFMSHLPGAWFFGTPGGPLGSLTPAAPCCRRRTELDEITGEETSSTYVSGFTVAHVFDISQTEGEELPEVRAELLDGAGPEGLWDALVAQVESAGFVVERADCGTANGRTDYAIHTVTVRPDVSGAQACKTLAHEFAHVLMHRERLSECRGVVEVEAESAAYLVCEACGVVTDSYSFPYVAVWAGGDSDLVRSTAERVITTAREVLDGLGLIGGKPVEAAA